MISVNKRLLALILICLGLGVLAWFDHQRSVDPSDRAPSAELRQPTNEGAKGEGVARPEPQVNASDAVRIGNPLASLDLSQLKATVERPLFAPSRRRPPEPMAAPAPATSATPVPSFDLLGVVRNAGRAIALLRDKANAVSLRVEAGDFVSGWQVAKVESTLVLLTRKDGTSQTVTLLRN